MRVLVVTNMYPTEGMPFAGTFVAEQVESVRRLGVDVDVLHLERPESGRRVYRGLAAKVRRHVAETQPDVVHAAYGGVMAEAVTRAARDRPVLITFHGSDLMGGPSLAARGGVIASRIAARRAAGIIVVSPTLRPVLPRAVDRERVWIVPNGVDLERFRARDPAVCRESLGWNQSTGHVLFPSTPFRPEKRFELARAAVERVNHGRKVELHSLDRVAHADVPIWLNAADVMLLTSTHEGSPVVVKEALACGVPIVSVDVGDVRERIEGIEGCHIASATPEDLAGRIESVLERGRRIDARSRVEELSLERIGGRVRNIYEQLAASALAPHRA